MRASILALAALAAAGTSASASAAICLEPRAPFVFLRKPTKPYCAMDRSCEAWEVELYRSQVKKYFTQLEDYLSEVDRFQKEAVEYAQCMAKLD
jgi:hypothetical protein